MSNIIIQLGRLADDVELRHTSAGTAVINGTIVTNRSIKKKDGSWVDEPTFVSFTMWGPRAEAFSKYHKKGDLAYLTGRLSNDTWEDRATGERRTKTKMTAEEWEFVTPKKTVTDVDDTPF